MNEKNDDELPALVEDLSLGCFRLVKESVDFELDFSVETLPVLDHYLSDLVNTEDSDVARSVVGPCAGAYFGEVVRRSLPSVRWVVDADDYQAWRIEFSRCFLSFNPVGMVLESMVREQLTGWNGHLSLLPEDQRAVRDALEATGGVREEDYFRLSVRHEVIEQTASVLQNIATQRGDLPRIFTRDVYAAVSKAEA